MKQRHFMVALDMLDEVREAYTEAAFVPTVVISAEEEKDIEAEIEAFVNRADPTFRGEASSSICINNDVGTGSGKTPFSEAAGFSGIK